MMKIASPDYFEKWSTTAPFFVQAAKELGYYGYDMTPFKKYQKYFDLKNCILIEKRESQEETEEA